MTERPIIFSVPMVPAILDGRKTQTRRVIDKKKYVDYSSCPFGVVGDLLYVREAWWPWLDDKGPEGFTRLIRFADDFTMPVPDEHAAWFDIRSEKGWHKRPSIHMPKWAARIWLKVEDVRVERLQEISTDDAIQEGARPKDFIGKYGLEIMWSMETPMPVHGQCLSTARMAFANFISQLHGGKNWNLKPSNLWDENPWVWAVSFSVASTAGRRDVQK